MEQNANQGGKKPQEGGKQPKQQQAKQQQPKQQKQQPKQQAKQPKPQQKPQPTQAKKEVVIAAPKEEEKPVSAIKSLFSHIPSVRKWSSRELLAEMGAEARLIHPALLEFAVQMSQDVSLDEDEKTRRFLQMMAVQIKDEPKEKESELRWGGDFARRVKELIKRTMKLLSITRLTPIGIENAKVFLKCQLPQSAMSREFVNEEGEDLKDRILSAIDHFIEEKIDEVTGFIARTTSDMILDGDVVLTYGFSPVICKAIKMAQAKGVNFRVIVVDSRPNFDSKRMIDLMLADQTGDIDVRYVLMSGISYVMPEVKKVLIEPCGILANNAAVTQVGTAMISMVAHEYGVPVIFACPSYRFVNDVRIDALSRNEMLDSEIMKPVPKADVKPDPEYLALAYDVTPGQYVDIVISELGNLPVNSISTNIKFIKESYKMFARPEKK